MYRLLLNPQTNALCIIHAMHPEALQYFTEYTTCLRSGTYTDVLQFAHIYWAIHWVPDEEQILLHVRRDKNKSPNKHA